MRQFWWGILIKSLRESLQAIGKEPSDILFSLFVFLIVGFILLVRQGWPKGLAAMKDKIGKVISEDFAIVLCLFILLTLFHMVRNSYLKWKSADDEARQTKLDFDEYRSHQQKPDFRVKVTGLVLAPGGEKDTAVVGAIAPISNLGAPSAISGFWLEVKFDDGRDLDALIASPGLKSENIPIGKNPDGSQMYLPPYWPSMMFDVMPQYGNKVGFIMGIVRGTTKEEIIAKHGKIIFTCIDPTTARASGEEIAGGISGPDQIGLRDLQRYKFPKPPTP